ncbi:Retrotransposon protein, Ty3-gypsy subclass [Phytophthora megakarya]|uniref:Retrotransposon protein, Ty3-gypsy subclass n=1 Tax=Phytophthora megakarya TaxID=4795 RepID=A0A225X008_9STRA|nr:Retrotransposon protein, Ty3-gypsy subclass [Phytophthora megakarya]
MQRVLVELIPHNAQVWIDDVLIYAKTGGEFNDVIRRSFLLLHRHNLKLNLKESCLFQREVTWCGRVISGDGVRHDPARISALTELPLPTTAAELQYFVCTSN